MHVLIVERDDLMGSLLADALASDGIAARVLPDESALKLPVHQAPRLVITCMNRGHREDLTGMKLVAAMRSKWPELSAIYLAPLWPLRLRPEMLLKHERFLSKPFPMEQLARTVRELMDGPR